MRKVACSTHAVSTVIFLLFLFCQSKYAFVASLFLVLPDIRITCFWSQSGAGAGTQEDVYGMVDLNFYLALNRLDARFSNAPIISELMRSNTPPATAA